MSSDSDIRTTMRQVADGAEAPVIDKTGFERRVRRHRNRRRASLAGATAAVAALALAVPLTVSQIGSSDAGSPEAPVVGAPEPPPPAYFVLGGRAVMLDPDGTLHQLGLRAEAIIGPTTDGVLVSDGTSRLVHVQTTDGGPPQHTELPIGPVQSAAVSADGRRVAVVDLDENVIVYDLVSEHELDRIPNDQSAYVADFSDRVLYAVGDDSLRLGLGDDAIDVPADDGPAWQSAVGENTVAVTSEYLNGTTRIYDVSQLPTPVKIAELPGAGDLSPNGEYFLAITANGDPVLWDRATGDRQSVTGLDGGMEQVRWVDDDFALVATGVLLAGKQVKLLYGCAVTSDNTEIHQVAPTSECHELLQTEENIWLGH